MKKQLAIGLAATLGGLGVSVFAGDDYGAEKPQMFCIYKEIVKPAMSEQYEDAMKYLIREFTEYGVDPEKVNWTAISGPEMGYVYVMPLENWAGMDQMRDNWMEAIEAIGKDRFEEIMAPAEEAMEEIQIFHALKRDDLSYTPENPRLKPEEATYIHYGFYYALPGKGKELEALAKEFSELYKSKGIDSGWSFYQKITGSDLPVYVVAVSAKSAADYYTNREKIAELLGEAAKKIGEKIGSTVRRIEYKEGMLRPELSYPVPTYSSMETEKEGAR